MKRGAVLLGSRVKIAEDVAVIHNPGESLMPVVLNDDCEIGFYCVLHPGVQVGVGARISSHVVMERECVIGDNGFVGCHTILRPQTIAGARTAICHCVVSEGWSTIGEDCIVHDHTQLTKGAKIEDKVFIGPKVNFTNDPYIAHHRRDLHPDWFSPPTIKYGARVGSSAILVAKKGGLLLGRNCLVGAGAVVNKDVPDNAIVMGIPARVVGEVSIAERI